MPGGEQLLQPFPDHVPRLRVEARGRLVHEDQVRVVHQRAGERQAALHAARQFPDTRVLLVREVRELEQPRNAREHFRVRQPEVAAVHDEVLGHGEVRIEVVHLRHDADADARAPGVARHRLSDQHDLAGIGLGEAEATAQGRRLAGAVRAEQRVTRAASNRERQAVDDRDAAVVLAQPVDDEHVIGKRGGRLGQGAHAGDQSKRPAGAAGLCSLAGAGAQLASSAAGAASGCGRSTSSTNAIGALSPTRKPIFRMRV